MYFWFVSVLTMLKVYPPHQFQIFKQLYTFRKFLHPTVHWIFQFLMIQTMSKLKKCLSVETILYLIGPFFNIKQNQIKHYLKPVLLNRACSLLKAIHKTTFEITHPNYFPTSHLSTNSFNIMVYTCFGIDRHANNSHSTPSLKILSHNNSCAD